MSNVHGIVVATAKPRPEKAAHTFNTTTDGNITVNNIDMPNKVRPKIYVALRPTILAILSWTKLENKQAEIENQVLSNYIFIDRPGIL